MKRNSGSSVSYVFVYSHMSVVSRFIRVVQERPKPRKYIDFLLGLHKILSEGLLYLYAFESNG